MMLGMDNFMHRPGMTEYGYYPGQAPPAMNGQGAYGQPMQPGQAMHQYFQQNLLPYYPAMGMPGSEQANPQMYRPQTNLQETKPHQFPGELLPLSINTSCPTNPDDEPPPITPPPQRERFSYTRYQLELLSGVFEKVRYPNSIQKQLIAKRVGITRDQVKIWFQNRRRKDVVGNKHSKSPETTFPSNSNDPKMVPGNVMQSVITELVRYENDPKGKKLRARLAANELRPKPYDISARPGQLWRVSPENKAKASEDLSACQPQPYSLPLSRTPPTGPSSDVVHVISVSPISDGTESHSASSLNSSVPSPQNESSKSSSPDQVPALNPLDMPAPPNAVAPASTNLDEVRKKLLSAADHKNATVAQPTGVSPTGYPLPTVQSINVTIPQFNLKDPKYSPLSSDESLPKRTMQTSLPATIPMPSLSSSSSDSSTSPGDFSQITQDSHFPDLSKLVQFPGFDQQLTNNNMPPQASSTAQMPSSGMDYPRYSNPQMAMNPMAMHYSYGQMADVKPLNIDRVYPFPMMADPTMRMGAMSNYSNDPYSNGHNPMIRDPYQSMHMASYNNAYYGSQWAGSMGAKDSNNYTAV